MYADVCWRMLTYADVCYGMLVAKEIPDAVFWRMLERMQVAKEIPLAYADLCWRMQVAKEIPDATAIKPADWNEADDGPWEAPLVPNPAYAGAQVYEALSYYECIY